LKINLKLALSSLVENSTKDKIWSYNKYLDKYNDFSSFRNHRKFLKENYLKKGGISLGVNNINNKSSVGKTVELLNKYKKYLSNSYIFKNKDKMAICSAIYKYDIDKISFYILEIIENQN